MPGCCGEIVRPRRIVHRPVPVDVVIELHIRTSINIHRDSSGGRLDHVVPHVHRARLIHEDVRVIDHQPVPIHGVVQERDVIALVGEQPAPAVVHGEIVLHQKPALIRSNRVRAGLVVARGIDNDAVAVGGLASVPIGEQRAVVEHAVAPDNGTRRRSVVVVPGFENRDAAVAIARIPGVLKDEIVLYGHVIGLFSADPAAQAIVNIVTGDQDVMRLVRAILASVDVDAVIVAGRVRGGLQRIGRALGLSHVGQVALHLETRYLDIGSSAMNLDGVPSRAGIDLRLVAGIGPVGDPSVGCARPADVHHVVDAVHHVDHIAGQGQVCGRLNCSEGGAHGQSAVGIAARPANIVSCAISGDSEGRHGKHAHVTGIVSQRGVWALGGPLPDGRGSVTVALGS